MTTTTDLRCFIGGTDYGALGAGKLRALQTTPSGPEQIGLAAVGLGAAGGGGYSILNKAEVKIYEWTSTNHNPSVGYISAVYYGGFVNLPDTGRQAASTDKTWTVQAQDYNLLKKRLVSKAAASQAIVLTSGHFDTQIASLFSQLGGGSALIDASSQVANLTGTTNLPAQTFQGKSVEHMLDAICKAAVAANSALAPRYMIAPDYTTGPTRTSWGVPLLYVWDANAVPVSTMTLSDAVAGDILAVGYSRKLDSTDQVTWQQSIRPSTGYVATGSSASAISTYPNPYDVDGAWKDEPIQDTTSTSNAAADAAITERVATLAFPRETLTLSTQRTPPPLPGQYVTISLSLEGIVSGLYLVAATSVSYGSYLLPTGGQGMLLTTQLQLGQARLLLGQDPASVTGGTAPSTVVPPDVPTSLGVTTAFDPYVGNSVNTYTWTLPGNLAHIIGYAVYETTGGLTYRNYVAGASVTSLATRVNPGQAFTAVVHSVSGADNNNLESVDSNTASITSAAQYAPDPPTSLHITASGIDDSGKAWARVGFTAPGTTHGPHDLYDFRRVTGSQEIHVSVPGTSTEAVFSNLTPEVTYTVSGRTLSLPAWYGAYSSTLSVRVSATKPPPDLGGGGAPTVDQALYPYAQTAGTATFSIASTGGMDGAACYSVTSTGADTPTLTQVAFPTRAGQAWTVRSAAQKSTGSPTWAGYVDWDDGSGTWALTSSALTLPSLGTSWPSDYTEQQVKAPSTALFGRLRYVVTTAAALTVLLSIPSPTPAKTVADLYPKTSSSAPIPIYDSLGNLRGSLYADGSTPNLNRLHSVNTGGIQSGWEVDSTFGDSFFVGDNAAGGGITGTAAGGKAITLNGGASAVQIDANGTTHTGAANWQITNLSGSATLDATETVIRVDCTGGAVTLTLPAASGQAGRWYLIKKTDSSANKITIQRSGTDLIDGATSVQVSTQYGVLRLISSGSDWGVY